MPVLASVRSIFGWALVICSVLTAAGVLGLMRVPFGRRLIPLSRPEPPAVDTAKTSGGKPGPERLTQIAALLAALAGYFYVFGGAQLFMKFTANGLPTAALDDFTARRFLTIGVAVGLVVLALTLAVVIAAAIIWRLSTGRLPEHASARVFLTRLGVGAFVVLTLFVTFVFPFVRPFSLSVATVRLKSGACLVGPFIAEDSTGVHLLDGHNGHLTNIPEDAVTSVTLDGTPEIDVAHVRAGVIVTPGGLLERCSARSSARAP